MNNEKWLIQIKPKGKGIDFNFREIWAYRDLVVLFVKREFVSKYKQTILGPMWAIIQPLLTTVVFTIIFGNLANLTTADAIMGEEIRIPSFLFYMSGTIIWSYFSSTVSATSNTFIGNAHIMGKVYFPRMVTPIATALSNMISFGIQLLMFVAILAVCIMRGEANVQLSANIVILPIIILQLILISTSVGIIISSLTTKYRDLAMLVGFGLELWKYATPVAYGLLLIPPKWLSVYMINPVTPIVTTFRYVFFGMGYFSWFYFLVSWIVTLLVFIFGMLMFNRIEKTFMDTI